MSEAIQQLETLRKQYFSLYPLFQLQLPPSEVLFYNQEYLLSKILDDPHLAQYHPEAGYQKTFWRRIVAKLEEGLKDIGNKNDDLESEVDERFYELMADLMVSRTTEAGPSTPGSSFRTFIYNTPDTSDEKRITLMEELAAIQAGTTGLRTWTAALHLAHHILRDPRILPPHGSTSLLPPILELGAGTGFLSILLAQLGADVVASDLGDSDVQDEEERRTPLARLQSNVVLNHLSHSLRVVSLDWMDANKEIRPEPWPALLEERRTIVAADIIYDPDLVPAIVSTLSVFLNNDPESCAVIAATVRNESTLALFVDTCEKRGLSISTLSLAPTDEANPTFWDSALEGRSEVRIMRIGVSKSTTQ